MKHLIQRTFRATTDTGSVISLNRIIIRGVVLFLLGCSTKAPPKAAQAFEVSALRSGLLEFRTNGDAYISQAGNQFPYVESGRCVVAGNENNCLWHGFEFLYRSPVQSTLIECKFESNRTQDRASPARYGEANATGGTFSFVLQGRSGRYVRPQYTTGLKGHPFKTTTWCSREGVEIFRFTLTLIP